MLLSNGVAGKRLVLASGGGENEGFHLQCGTWRSKRKVYHVDCALEGGFSKPHVMSFPSQIA